MPLVKRSIEPLYVSRVEVPAKVQNDLEFVTNSTLANLILQLSSLSKRAEDTFSELHREMSSIFYRNCKLNEHVDRLKQKIQQLNPVKDSVSLQDMNQRKPFKSSVTREQQILSLSSRPEAIIEKYNNCEPPPPLNKLDAYREDNRDSLKFYTDPGYFMELWCQEMVKDADNQQKKQKNRNKRTRPMKEPRTIRAPKTHMEEFKDRRHGPEFMGLVKAKEPNYQDTGPKEGQGYGRPNSLEISTPPASSQLVIAGHGFGPSDYGLAFVLDGRARESINDYGIAPGTPNTTPGYNRSNVDFLFDSYNENVGLNHVDSVSNRSTPSKQKKPHQGHDPGMRQYGSLQGDRHMQGDGRGHGAKDTMSPRPTMPPPAPPDATDQRRGNLQPMRSQSIVNRDNLPPPPPTPGQQVTRSESSASKSGRTTYSPPKNDYSQQPIRVMAGSPKEKFNNSFDLPPPPSPPPMSIEQIPSPPPIPPPPLDDMKDQRTCPPPPPLPPLSLLPKDVKNLQEWDNNNDVLHVDNASLASDTSSATVSSKTEEQVKVEKPAVRDTRSDLLSAIRTGFQLRKVEERRLKTQEKQNTSARLDVQAIMEAAFERRRKALEENDSEKDEDDDAEENWSDDG